MFQGFHFENKEYLYGLFFILILIFIFVLTTNSKNKAIRKFGNYKFVKNLMPYKSTFRPILKFVLSMLTLSFVILAIARPQFGSKLKEVKNKGAEIIIALDISNSMLAKEKGEKRNRLDKAKNIINRIVDNYKSDKIGLIVFAGEAYTQAPLTMDYKSVKLIVKSIEPGFISAQGTAIGEAIKLATASFPPNDNGNKSIIIISDGENHEGNADNIAESVGGKGIMVHTIGIGSVTGSPVPDPKKPLTYLRDKKGEFVVSKLNREMLEEIAIAGKGAFIDANSNSNSLNIIFEQIDKAETGEITTYEEYDDKFQFFILIAFILLIINIFILDRKNKWLSKIKFFD